MGGILTKISELFTSSENKIIYKKLKEGEIQVIKIHLCGKGERKQKVIDLLFDKKISRSNLKSKGDREYKSRDFYWIIKIYKDEILSEEKVQEIEKNIEEDKTAQNDPINYHIMLLFGEENDMEMILDEFSDINRPRIIFVTNNKCTIKESNNKRYVKNIIYEGMNDNELNCSIISSLWELDCYYFEKGNEIFRHTPINIAKGLETDNSLYSINILLTGMCRSGKSSFINLISGKLVALETNDTESVTLKISEYYIYKNDEKKEHGVIKLIDTPGVCEKEEVNSKTLKEINDYIINKDKKLEKQIHFVLFFFMEQATLGNADPLLKLLNDSQYPVFFIINKSYDKSYKGKSQDIKSKIKYLKKRSFNRLADENNFIQVNIKSKSGRFYGVDEIFKKIEQYIIENNLMNRQILEKMLNIQKEYRFSTYRNDTFVNTNKNINKKKQINEIDEIYSLLKTNILFKNVILDNIKAHGRKIASKYEEKIILLSNLKNVFPETFKNIPILSFLQAFMIKEIGAGYGFDFKEVNYCIKKFDKDIERLKIEKIEEIKEEEKSQKNEKLKIYQNEIIEEQRDEINNTIKNIWHNSNEQVIKILVNRIHQLTKISKNEKLDENMINIENTMAISKICQFYFEKELDSTKGLPFLIYYFQKNQLLMEDIKFYTNKKDWEKDEVEIIEKKQNQFIN